jgi:hypothetical protein
VGGLFGIILTGYQYQLGVLTTASRTSRACLQCSERDLRLESSDNPLLVHHRKFSSWVICISTCDLSLVPTSTKHKSVSAGSKHSFNAKSLNTHSGLMLGHSPLHGRSQGDQLLEILSHIDNAMVNARLETQLLLDLNSEFVAALLV